MCRLEYLSGETMGICVAFGVSVGRLVGGFGRSGLLSALLAVIVSSSPQVTLRFSAAESKENDHLH